MSRWLGILAAVVHADGFVERGRQLYLGAITFAGPDVAVATGHWSLWGVYDDAYRTSARAQGACALAFLKVQGEGWRFLALQYAERDPQAPPPLTRVPNLLVK